MQNKYAHLDKDFFLRHGVFLFVFTSLSFSGIPALSKVPHVLFALLCFGLFPYVSGNRQIRFKIEFILPILFVFFVGVLALFGKDSATDVFMSTAMAWAGGCLVAYFIQKRRVKIDTVLYAFAAASVANSLSVMAGFDSYAIYSADFREVSEEALGLRASGLVGNANLMAVQALLPLFALVLWGNRIRFVNLIWLCCLSSALYTLSVSGSRKGVLLLMMFVVFVFVVNYFRSNNVRFILMGLLSVGLLVLVMFFIGADYNPRNILAIDRIYYIFEGGDTSFDDRSDFLGIGYLLFIDSPLFGHGLDMFRHLSGYGLYSHNNLIELAVSGGGALLLLFYAIHLVIVVKYASLNGAHLDIKVGSLLLLAVLFFLDFSMVTYGVRVYVFVMTILLLCKHAACQYHRFE